MATSSIEPTKILCIVCNKAKGIYTCGGCSRVFCPKHSIDHRNELNEQLEEVTMTHDIIQQRLDQQIKNPQQHSLIEKINQWEEESIIKIRQVAEKVRNQLLEDTIQYTNQMKQELQILTNELREGREENDFSEIDLQQWKQKLEELKKEIDNPMIVTIQEDPTPLVTNIRIEHQNISEVFARVCGIAEIKENGCLVVKTNDLSHTEIRGRDAYNTGNHKIRFQIEKLVQDGWIFFGILSKSEPMRVSSYGSPSSYGWSSANQIYVGGSSTTGTTTKIVQNDIIELLINCEQQKIELKNERTNKTMELFVDINKCPFPWQLHLNLHTANTRVRILF